MSALLFNIIYGVCWLISLLPLPILYVLSDLSFPITYYIIRYRRKIVLNNLRNSFPEKQEKEIRMIARKFYHHLNDLLFETIKMIHLTPEKLARRITVKNPDFFTRLYEKRKSALAVIGHYNNWEWILGIQPLVSHHSMAIYKQLNSKRFNYFILKIRSKFKTEIIAMRDTLRIMLNYQKQNIPTITAFIADQSPVWEETQYWTTFLNQLTPVYLGIEKLAKKTGQSVIFLHLEKIARGRYQVEVMNLCDDVNKTLPYEITEKHVKLLEDIIRRKPEYWLWSHRRWKLTPKKLKEIESQRISSGNNISTHATRNGSNGRRGGSDKLAS